MKVFQKFNKSPETFGNSIISKLSETKKNMEEFFLIKTERIYY